MSPSADFSAGLSPLPADNAVIVFRTERSGVSGRLVRLGEVAEHIIRAHAMPDSVSGALGETIVLAALLGSALKGSGTISVQTQTDGAIPVLYADCQEPGKLRGYARFDAAAVQAPSAGHAALGVGHLAVTIDTGRPDERYQGVIALDGGPLAAGAAAYFHQRENLPTFVRLAVAQHYPGATHGLPPVMCWGAGGIMMQHIAHAPGGDADDDAWARVQMLTATVEDHELLDPALTPEQLLLRLFHEEGVVIERVVPLTRYCKCSREKVLTVLSTFGAGELSDMRDVTGKISAKCEFCASSYAFDLAEIETPPEGGVH